MTYASSSTGPPAAGRDQRLRVLHVVASLGPTNAQYHEHCLPVLGERNMTVCSLLPASLEPVPQLRLVHGDGTRLGALRAVITALRRDEYDVVHAHVPVSAAVLLVASLLTGRALRSRVFSMTNSYESYKRRNRLLLVPAVVTSREVVLCSDAVAASLPAMLRRLAAGRTTVIPNGVNTGQIAKVAAQREPDRTEDARPFTVVSVSRLVPIKDHPTVLEAFRRVARPEDRFVLVGDGPLRAELEAVTHGDDSVRLTGLLARDEVYRELLAGDVYVSASRGEGLPVAVLEAMACGRPVVLSDIPPHRELADGSDAVALVRCGDVEGFGREIARLRQMDATQREAIGRRCRLIAEKLYGVRSMHDALARVYARVAGEGAADGRRYR